MTSTNISIRPLAEADRAEWEPLWRGYQTFYEVEIPDDATEETFRRLLDPACETGAFVADAGAGRLIGLAHWVATGSTWAKEPYCYLNDLFVDQANRGAGVGGRLIEAVAQEARARNYATLYWLTHETNATAMRLYDAVADKTGFVHYRKALG